MEKKNTKGDSKKERPQMDPKKIKKGFLTRKSGDEQKRRKNDTGTLYGDIFTKEFSIQELDRYLTKIKKNTAPGKSGIRVDHIISLPTEQRTAIAKLLSLPNLTGLGYDNWAHELVNWIPKE